jgi:glutathione synthase/RimK-type ligase-like ATP-grasp enzyme
MPSTSIKPKNKLITLLGPRNIIDIARPCSLVLTAVAQTNSLNIALLTRSNLTDYNDEDLRLLAALKELGHKARTVVWDEEKNWSQFDCAVIRTTWDYTEKLEAFCETILTIDQSGCRLFNPADVVLWNINKSYLIELGTKGVSTIPTVWCDAFDAAQLFNYEDEIGTENFIVKPAVGACASNLFRFSDVKSESKNKELMKKLRDSLEGKEVLLQPYIESVAHEGEYSFHFFNGEFSHAIIKKAKAGDFRVQQEFGGSVEPYQPNAIELSQATLPLQHIPGDWLYARVDMIRGDHQNLWLIELEAIEPALYFRFAGNSKAEQKLAKALEHKMNLPRR